MTKCPNCNRENEDQAQICVYCGVPLVDLSDKSSTRSLEDTDYEEGDPKWGAARFAENTSLRIDVLDTAQYFLFSADELGEITLGRVNPDTNEGPEVDLTDSGALDKGVSRQHARIVYHNGALYVIDNNSANGTFLNGQKLIAGQARILRDGDDIRLGHLVVRMTYLKSN